MFVHCQPSAFVLGGHTSCAVCPGYNMLYPYRLPCDFTMSRPEQIEFDSPVWITWSLIQFDSPAVHEPVQAMQHFVIRSSSADCGTRTTPLDSLAGQFSARQVHRFLCTPRQGCAETNQEYGSSSAAHAWFFAVNWFRIGARWIERTQEGSSFLGTCKWRFAQIQKLS